MSKTLLRLATRAACLTTLLAAGAWTASTPVVAQDSHYWSEQYGTRSALLGGAMIGSVRDLSAVYYNPGALALYRDAGFLLSARVYRASNFTLENAAGEGSDLGSSSTRPIATFLATPLEFGFLGDHVLVYSVLTRQQMGLDISSYQITQDDVFDTPGPEDIAGAYNGSTALRETWTGLAWAYPLTENLGIGAAPYLAIRSHEIRSELLLQAATSANDVAIATRLRSRRYKHYRFLTKLGLTYERGDVSLGVNATTPSISLLGDGRAVYNGSAASTDPDSLIVETPLLVSNVQSDLSSEFESGWAVGAGLGWTLGGTRVHLSGEWFEGRDRFTVVDAEDFVPQTGGDPVDNDATFESVSILNWGVGIEQDVGSTRVYLNLSTDNSAAADRAVEINDVTFTKYDLLRFGGGASFRLGRADIMLGLGWARGKSPFVQLFDLGRFDPDLDPGELADIDLKLSQWSAVLGFEWTPADSSDEER
ncbi:MAG: hypothetical protein AMS19_03450 [Gemmatimonas sp. SG8_23]|nr:MAG: hypothetical protein AMS19_03450 [Gemmatimonas sp. SG8_23]